VLFDASDLVTDVDSFGQDVEKLLIKGVDALAESQEFGRRIGGRHLCKGISWAVGHLGSFSSHHLGSFGATVAFVQGASIWVANSNTTRLLLNTDGH
jgi:hypothetical protein